MGGHKKCLKSQKGETCPFTCCLPATILGHQPGLTISTASPTDIKPLIFTSEIIAQSSSCSSHVYFFYCTHIPALHVLFAVLYKFYILNPDLLKEKKLDTLQRTPVNQDISTIHIYIHICNALIHVNKFSHSAI